MKDRTAGQVTLQRLLLVTAAFVVGSIGWFLLGDSDSLIADEEAYVPRPLEEAVWARVDGVEITAREVRASVASELEALELQRREILEQALKNRIDERLIAAGANRHSSTAGEVEVEVLLHPSRGAAAHGGSPPGAAH